MKREKTPRDLYLIMKKKYAGKYRKCNDRKIRIFFNKKDGRFFADLLGKMWVNNLDEKYNTGFFLNSKYFQLTGYYFRELSICVII